MPELVWDGKYDANGKRVHVPKIALPFQTVETINEDTRARERSLSLFESGEPSDWRNRLIWGDKKWVLPSLLPEFGGKVDLIYIDPPFDTGADFSFSAQIPDDPNREGDNSQSFTKEPSLLELKAYRDIWGGAKTHLDAYLKWFYETVVVLYDLLSPTGSIYVHLDWHVSHYAKAILDEVFGAENFRNEIAWKRSDAKGDATQGSQHYARINDSIFYYVKSEKATWNTQFVPLSEKYVTGFYKYTDEDGRKYKMENMLGPGGEANGNPVYEVMGVTRPWRYSKKRMQQLIDDGLVIQTNPGTVPMQKKYLEDSKGVQLSTWWDDISMIRGWSSEKVGYATQKPEALLERIIRASSNEDDLVLDCFCGSGTTAAVAEKLGRRWITCDLGRFAIHTARKRLLAIPDLTPFQVQNLGKYERQAWRKSALNDDSMIAEHQRLLAYRKFILDLYHARPLEGTSWLHGVKNGRYVHVGSIDSPVSEGDITQIALEWKRATGGAGADEGAFTNGIDVLGWEFAFEINDIKVQQAARANISITPKIIPREVMEKRAADAGEIQFFELAALEIGHQIAGQTITLELKNFMAPLDYLPAEVQGSITSWEQMVDYWAIDWDYQGDAFHNQWQSYRTKASPKLEKSAKFSYDSAGVKRVVVKVIDILGNDTSKLVEVGVD